MSRGDRSGDGFNQRFMADSFYHVVHQLDYKIRFPLGRRLHRAEAHRMLRMLVSFIVSLLLATLGQARAEESPPARRPLAVPSAKLLGSKLGIADAFPKSEGRQLPESVQFDLDPENGLVFGLIAKYPVGTAFEDLIAAVNRTEKKWFRDDSSDLTTGVCMWRNEKSRVVYQASETQLIMLWLDRRVTDEEVKLFSDAFRRIEAEIDKNSSQDDEAAK